MTSDLVFGRQHWHNKENFNLFFIFLKSLYYICISNCPTCILFTCKNNNISIVYDVINYIKGCFWCCTILEFLDIHTSKRNGGKYFRCIIKNVQYISHVLLIWTFIPSPIQLCLHYCRLKLSWKYLSVSPSTLFFFKIVLDNVGHMNLCIHFRPCFFNTRKINKSLIFLFGMHYIFTSV